MRTVNPADYRVFLRSWRDNNFDLWIGFGKGGEPMH